jgi:predicted transcriptional regulator
VSLDHSGDETGGTEAESDPTRVRRRVAVAQALGDAGFGDVLVLSHESADRALTPARRELIDVLSSKSVESQRQLAEIVGRDPGNVQRDIDVLIEEGVVARERDGKSMRPSLTHETVVVEPITAGSASDADRDA